MNRRDRNFAGRLMSCVAFTALTIGAGSAIAQEVSTAPRPAPLPAAEEPAAADQAVNDQAADDQASEVGDVVVTGTLIRGIAPVGANVQSIGQQDIKRIGAISTNQILANIPVISNQFNTTANTPTNAFLNVFRPNIRKLGDVGGNTTLVLVDGHNQVGVGTLQTSPDAGMIPAGALERVEVLADGGSALYGADAVGGIVNYITRSRFEGFEVSSRAGVAEGGYHAYDLNVTGGTAWSSGSFMLAATMRANSPLYSDERERPRQDLRPWGGSDFRVRTCSPGNIVAGGVTYAMQTRIPGSLNLCDATELGNIVPEERLYSVFTSVTQELAPNLHFEMKGIYSDRITESRSAQISVANVVINRNNPFFSPIGAENQQTVSFNFSPYAGLRAVGHNEIKQYTLTPQITWDLPNDWQMKALYNIGWSETNTATRAVAPDISRYLSGPGLTTTTALNPYDLLATSPATLAYLTGSYRLIGFAEQKLDDFRTQFDGPVYELPGGTVRAAVGVEWQRASLDARYGTALSVDDPRIGRGNASREVSSVFTQFAVPIIGEANALPLVQSFILDLSARYDSYSDFGSTTNPKVAFTWEVGSGLQFRGNWGTSFNAPSLADTSGGADARASYSGTSGALPPGALPMVEGQRPTITISGGNPNLKPQTADTWSLGLDYTPTFVSGLQFSATYWSVEMSDTIGLTPSDNTLFSIPTYSNYYVLNPTLAQLQSYVGSLPLENFPTTDLATLYGNGSNPYLINDRRRNNYGTLAVNGVDFRVGYRQPVSWGEIFGSVAGTRTLKRDQQAVAGGVTADLLAANFSKLSLSTTVGVTVGNLTASVTQNFSSGYDVTGVINQTKVDSFAPINASFRYDFNGDRFYDKDLSLSLNVDNVFEDDPPFINLAGLNGGIANGSSLGRYVSVGISKRF